MICQRYTLFAWIYFLVVINSFPGFYKRLLLENEIAEASWSSPPGKFLKSTIKTLRQTSIEVILVFLRLTWKQVGGTGKHRKKSFPFALSLITFNFTNYKGLFRSQMKMKLFTKIGNSTQQNKKPNFFCKKRVWCLTGF